MRTTYLGAKSVQNGYAGRRQIVHLCFDPETGFTLEVHPLGWHSALIPSACDADEAAWLLENDPTARRHYR